MYREVGLMQVVEILRRWQAGDSARTIAKATGLARSTVGKYMEEAERLGLVRLGAPPNNDQILALGRLGQIAPDKRAAPQAALLDTHREQITRWLRDDKLQLTRIAELLRPQVPVTYTTLRRYVRVTGLAKAGRDTVRMATDPPDAGGGHRERSRVEIGCLQPSSIRYRGRNHDDSAIRRPNATDRRRNKRTWAVPPGG